MRSFTTRFSSTTSGTVLPRAGSSSVEVYRPGYEWNGSVFRPAQVKVARRPAGGPV